MQNEAQYRAILETVADGVLVIDQNGIIEIFNPAAEEMFNCSQADVIGKNVNVLMQSSIASQHDQFLSRFIDSRLPRLIGKTTEVMAKRFDDSMFPIDLSLSKVEYDNQIKFVGVIRDITARKQFEAELIEAKNEAEKNNSAKTEFLSSVTHEFRTPLNAIIGFASLLEHDTSLTATPKKNARNILNAGNQLMQLVNDVMDLAKIEAGQIEVNTKPVGIKNILQNVISALQSEASSKSVSLNIVDNGKIGVEVIADNVRLQQVLMNVVRNAIRYNKSGGKVTVDYYPENKTHLNIRVADTGQGIPQSRHSELFEAFNRLGAERSEIEGIGIGLVIAHKLMELMNGSIRVESEEGEGTQVFISVPLVEVTDNIVTIQNEGEQAVESPIESKGNILVVEDNLTNQELFKQQLIFLGYEVNVANNGQEALDILNQQTFDVVLTDINMPKLDGYALTKRIRNGDGIIPKDLPVIAVTANNDFKDQEKCRATGMSDFIPKPVDLDELDKKLITWINGEKQKDSSRSGTDVKIKHTQYFNPSVLASTVGTDIEAQKIVLETYCSTSQAILDEILTAHKKHDAKEFAMACHKFKSSSKAVGAYEINNLCQHLESAGHHSNWDAIDANVSSLQIMFNDVNEQIQKYIDGFTLKNAEDVNITVMIIDDDLFSIELMSNLLRQKGLTKIITAMGGEEAVEKMVSTNSDIDIIFCDLNMPTMDGVEIIRYLAEESFNGGIVLISGENERVLKSAENIAKARHLYLLGAIEKPLTKQSLQQILEAYRSTAQANLVFSRDQSVSVASLKDAIRAKKIETFFQPKVDIKTGKLIGVESLARWRYRNKRLIYPDSFIGLAEDNDLINDITDLVFENSFRQMQKWIAKEENFSISLNISVDSLVNLDLPEIIVEYANRYDIPVDQIVLEITESRLMQDITSAMDVLTRLSLKGIKLSVDDFGTGYSSMEQLQRAPFSELKIDRAFVTNASSDKSVKAILESSVDLAKKLDLFIVAEGVESQSDWNLLATLDVNCAQGFLISKPLSAADFDNWLQYWRHKGMHQLVSA